MSWHNFTAVTTEDTFQPPTPPPTKKVGATTSVHSKTRDGKLPLLSGSAALKIAFTAADAALPGDANTTYQPPTTPSMNTSTASPRRLVAGASAGAGVAALTSEREHCKLPLLSPSAA